LLFKNKHGLKEGKPYCHGSNPLCNGFGRSISLIKSVFGTIMDPYSCYG